MRLAQLQTTISSIHLRSVRAVFCQESGLSVPDGNVNCLEYESASHTRGQGLCSLKGRAVMHLSDFMLALATRDSPFITLLAMQPQHYLLSCWGFLLPKLNHSYKQHKTIF